jgi:hypothetical protein
MPFRATSAPCALTTSVFVISWNCGPSFGGLWTTTETFKSIRRLRRSFNRRIVLLLFCSCIQTQHKTLSPVCGRMWAWGFQASTTCPCVQVQQSITTSYFHASGTLRQIYRHHFLPLRQLLLFTRLQQLSPILLPRRPALYRNPATAMATLASHSCPHAQVLFRVNPRHNS